VNSFIFTDVSGDPEPYGNTARVIGKVAVTLHKVNVFDSRAGISYFRPSHLLFTERRSDGNLHESQRLLSARMKRIVSAIPCSIGSGVFSPVAPGIGE
jgi:hypothetical protein